MITESPSDQQIRSATQTDSGNISYEAIYNTRIKKILVYVLCDGEAITDYIYDVSESDVKITKDFNGEPHIEFMLDGMDLMRFPVISIEAT